MKITSIDIQAFGCLSNLQVEVAPGLHVFYGPNEAGKSTLQQAVLALLWGFYEGDRARKAENDARERFAPWTGGGYSGRVEYELQNGRRYRVQRDFGSDDLPTTVWDTVTGNDVTNEFGRGRHGNIAFMLKHLGMTRRVFEACAFVSQGELFEVAGEGRASPQEVGETIMKLGDTAGRDVSAKMAVDRLSKVLAERVGGPAARARPLAVARAALDRHRRELEEIDLARREVAEDAAELEHLIEEACGLEQAVARRRYLLTHAEVDELKGRLKRLSDVGKEEASLVSRQADNETWASFPAEERDDVQRMWTSIRDRRERLTAEAGETSKRKERLRELSAEREETVRRQQGLGHLGSYPADRKPIVDGSLAAWRAARAIEDEAEKRLAAAENNAAPVLEEYGRLEAEVGSLTAADLDRIAERLRAAPVGPASAVIHALAAAAARMWHRIQGAIRWLLRRVARGAPVDAQAIVTEGSSAPWMSADEAAAILQRHRRYLEIVPCVTKFRDEESAAEEARGQAAAAAGRIREALSGLVEDVSDVQAAYAAFTRRVADRGELEALGARLAALEAELSAARESIGKFDAQQAQLAGAEAVLTERLEAALGRSGTLEEMIDAFEDGCRGKRSYDAARRGLSEAEERKGIILAGRSPQELEDMARRAEARLGEMASVNPDLSGARTGESPAALKEEALRGESELRNLRERISGLKTGIDTRLEGLRSRSEVEEEIARCEQEVADLDAFGDALRLAQDAIRQAMEEAHRNFAPHVGQFLSRGLARVTGGRYRKARLDPSTLAVTAEVPETGQIKSVETLSRGTRAAAYLLLRAGLAQHMSSLSEPVPLILDDPLVDLDDVRVQNFLSLLTDLSENVQVLLFTKDQGTREWFERNCHGRPEHRLSELGPDRLAVPITVGAFPAD